MTDIPTAAAEAAARALCHQVRNGRCYTHFGEAPHGYCRVGYRYATTALTAAAPLIAARAAADLRGGIEALRDEWRYDDGKDRSGTSDELVVKCFRRASRALDALLRERAR